MREAYELAWLTALLHGNGKFPHNLHIHDIDFLTPVEVGSIVIFTACVTYVEQSIIHVTVTCENIVPITREKLKTTEFHMTFVSDVEARKVLPRSYESGMKYLEAKRRVMEIVK